MSSIPLPALHVQTSEPPDPIGQYAKIVQLKSLMQGQQLQQQEMQKNQIGIQQQQIQMRDQQSFRQAMADPSMQGKTIGEVADMLAQKGSISMQSYVSAKKADLDHRKELEGLTKEQLANRKAGHDATEQIYGNLMNMPDDQLAQQWPDIVQQIKAIPGNEKLPLNPQQPMSKDALAQFGPFVSMGNSYFEQELARRTKAQELQGKQADTQIKVGEAGNIAKYGRKEILPGRDVPFSPEVQQQKIQIAQQSRPINVGNVSKTGIQAIADAIENGDQPPDMKGLYRNGAAVKAELANRGFNLARAQMDWEATQKHIKTLNGPQQLRMKQSIESAQGMLDKIEGLYGEWKQVAGTSGFKLINKATLSAMKNMPGRAGAVAQALDTQIADLTADLGNVYMGGNTPTDQALKLASKNLSAEWNDSMFQEGLKQARMNVKIRYNSIQNSQPSGVSADSMYPMPNQQQGTAQGSTQGPQVGEKKKFPNGRTATWDGHGWAAD